MSLSYSEVYHRGKNIRVPSVCVEGRTVVAVGKWIRLAFVPDEDWTEGQAVTEPEQFVGRLREAGLRADIFSFGQKVPETKPKYPYVFEWDNVAAIPLTTFDDWWEKLPQETRKNVRRAGKRGVEVKTVPLDDQLLKGIVEVYNADPIRQGVPNAHYGKSFETLKREVSTFPEVSEFIGAYEGEELIGYIKVLYLGQVAALMNIVSKNSHQDKRPTNALLAKAVERACEKGKVFLLYGKFCYGNKTGSPLAEFKRRNGFEQVNFPKYFIPVTARGRVSLALRLHRGPLGLLPAGAINALVKLRARLYGLRAVRRLLAGRRAGPEPAAQE
jgi:hypothetical protein